MARGTTIIIVLALVVSVGVSVWVSRRLRTEGDESRPRQATMTPAATATPTSALAATVTPRPVTVGVSWRAASGKGAESYSEGKFENLDLRYGEVLAVQRVCVSDSRKLTMLSYRDAVGHTDVPLLLGDRGSGRVDPTDRNCTLFDGIEMTKIEKCKCWFQCAGEAHWCSIAGLARRR